MDILNGYPPSSTVTVALFFFNQIKTRMEVCVFRDLSSVGLPVMKENLFSHLLWSLSLFLFYNGFNMLYV